MSGALVFAFTDTFILCNAWKATPAWNLFLISIPVAQCVLVAAWATSSKSNFGIRFALPLLTMLVGWKMVQHVIALPLESMFVMQWMLVFAWAVGIVLAGTRAKWVLDEAIHFTSFWTQYLRVDLKTMLMSTLVAGLAFGFLQYGRIHWKWSIDELNSRDLIVINMLGVLTGVQALSCLALTLGGSVRRRLIRAALHLTCLVVGAVVFSYWESAGDWQSGIREVLTFWLSGNLMIISAMTIGRWLSNKSSVSSQSETGVSSK